MRLSGQVGDGWICFSRLPQSLEVVDEAQRVSFTAPELQAVGNGESMLVVRSTAPIELRARSEHRFQLRSHDRSCRVLLDRLPAADVDHFALETIDGVQTLVAEIYVHR